MSLHALWACIVCHSFRVAAQMATTMTWQPSSGKAVTRYRMRVKTDTHVHTDMYKHLRIHIAIHTATHTHADPLSHVYTQTLCHMYTQYLIHMDTQTLPHVNTQGVTRTSARRQQLMLMQDNEFGWISTGAKGGANGWYTRFGTDYTHSRTPTRRHTCASSHHVDSVRCNMQFVRWYSFRCETAKL